MIALFALAAASGLPGGSFDCEVDKVAAVSVDGGKASASMIEGLPSEALKFRLSVSGGNAIVDWPNSPVQVSGKQVILPTGPGAGMAMYVAQGPCLFTEAACGNMLQLVQQPDKTLRLLITPTALSHDTEKDVRYPFLVLMEGVCRAGAQRK